ncbi:GNAT family N-acetyltransferase [Pseudolysinimonas sp.]|uniref:GNAT family N-acetyltransferase n=1 Tax=Pseudolysinimonas sp. TaxID=2680009 RepID=UPI0037845815
MNASEPDSVGEETEAIDADRARPTDVDDILAIQEENLIENGGSLSARFDRTWFESVIRGELLIVARVGEAVAGYAALTSQAAQAHIPIIQAMLRAHPDSRALLHGPICVASAFRRRGVARALLLAEREESDGASILAFIRADNAASRQSHVALGFREATEFEHAGASYIVVAG